MINYTTKGKALSIEKRQLSLLSLLPESFFHPAEGHLHF